MTTTQSVAASARFIRLFDQTSLVVADPDGFLCNA